MDNRLRPIVLLIAATLALTMLATGAAAGRACYVISNFAVPQYANITLNGTFFTIRLNYLGPNSAGITVNDIDSYSLALNQSVTVLNDTNFTYSSELLNVSWIPAEHTATISLCSQPNFQPLPTFITTSTSSLASTTATTSLQTTTTPPNLNSSNVAPQLPQGSPPPLKKSYQLIIDVVGVLAIIVVVVYSMRHKPRGHTKPGN